MTIRVACTNFQTFLFTYLTSVMGLASHVEEPASNLKLFFVCSALTSMQCQAVGTLIEGIRLFELVLYGIRLLEEQHQVVKNVYTTILNVTARGKFPFFSLRKHVSCLNNFINTLCSTDEQVFKHKHLNLVNILNEASHRTQIITRSKYVVISLKISGEIIFRKCYY